jgi:HD-GYP domain-containing protein (c-di-GMP phosphodiesterase class II)
MLREISFFSNMSDHDLRQIAEITVERKYEKNAIIIEEMTEAERFFIIHKGKIEISKSFEGGDKFILSVQSDGDFFGEMALLDEGRRSATVKALEPTTVLEISRADFETLLYKAPVLAYRILKELSARLRETGALLISHLKHSNRQIYRAYIDTMSMIIQAVERRGEGSASRTHRVRRLALALGRELGLSEEELLELELGSLFRDLGMLAVPDDLIGKKGGLSHEEFERIKRHVEEGVRMIQAVPLVAKAAPLALSHHERYDGRGYPKGLSGETIPLSGRIIALADAFAAMTSDRPHKARLSVDRAAEEIRDNSGRQFDPRVAEAFLRLYESGAIAEYIE